MSEIVTIVNTNGTIFSILKASVAGVLKSRNGTAVVFTTGGKITLGKVVVSAAELAEKLMGGDEDE